jgi:hypothetical protein
MADKNNSGDAAGSVTALELALASLKPSRSQIDRDRFLFLAGKVAAEAERRPSRFAAWGWPASTCLSAGTALVLLTLLLSRPSANASRPSVDLPPTVAGPSDAASAGSVVVRSNENAASTLPVAGELETATSEPSLSDVADSISGAPFNSLRLRYDRLASRGNRGNALAEPAPVSRGPLAPPPIEAPRSQRELLREFLNTERLAEASQENQAG